MAEPDYRQMWDHLRIRLQGKNMWETHELIDLMAQIEDHRRQRALQMELDRLKKGRTP